MLKKKPFLRIALLWVFALLLIGCSNAGLGGVPTLTASPVPSETPAPSETPTPTATPLPPVGALLIPEGANPRLSEQLQAFLAERIHAAGMRFQVRPTLSADDFEREDFQWVIALPPYPDLAALAASNPQSRFLAIGFGDLEAAANLAVIARPENGSLQQAFMAGYLSMVITPDWRAGMIRVNSPAGDLASQAFNNGALFFCASPSGSLACYSRYAPVTGYPIIIYGEPETTAEEWVTVGRYLLGQVVETVFVPADVRSDPLLRFLAAEEAVIIGTGTPPDELRPQWACSLEFDLWRVFEGYWPQFAAGSEGLRVEVPLQMTHINPDIISPGRQQFINQMLAEVQAGYITLVDETDASVNNP